MFVTFEGSEGSGKSTQIDLLAKMLEKRGFDVIKTREPGGTEIGEQVRLCLHDQANQGMIPAAEVLLYSASRAQLVEEVIRPSLVKGKIVLSDRYADSTIAYQGYGRQLEVDTLARINRFSTGGLRPDVTVFLDIDVQQGLTRRMESGAEMNRMDLQTTAFYRRVRNGYLEMAASEPERWVIIDANRPLLLIQSDIRKIILARLVSDA